MPVHLRHVALSRVEFRRNGEVAEFRELPAQVLDMLVYAEDLLDHEHGGERPTGRWHGAVGWNLASRDRNPDFAGIESDRVRDDYRLCTDRLHGKGEASCEHGHHELAAAPLGLRLQAEHVRMGHRGSLRSARESA